MEKIKVENHSFTAFSWFAGWLFSIGFLNLPFWKGLLALVLWPYYIGQVVAAAIHLSY
jgi:hypothetical protein